MISKPDGYEEVSTGWEPLSPGGHYLEIKDVDQKKSKKGDPMLVIEYDTHITDNQPKYFKENFNGSYWQGTHYIMLTGQEWAIRNLKAFITSVEKSNEGFAFDWDDEDNMLSLIGKNVGGVFGIVETEYKGERRKQTQLRWFCSTEKVPTVQIPEPKLLDPIVDDSSLPFDL